MSVQGGGTGTREIPIKEVRPQCQEHEQRGEHGQEGEHEGNIEESISGGESMSSDETTSSEASMSSEQQVGICMHARSVEEQEHDASVLAVTASKVSSQATLWQRW